MSDHRVHVTVWCMKLTLTHSMHSRSGPSVLFTLLPPSTIAARGSASDGSSSSWLPVEPKSKHRRKCISGWIGQTGGWLTPDLWPSSYCQAFVLNLKSVYLSSLQQAWNTVKKFDMVFHCQRPVAYHLPAKWRTGSPHQSSASGTISICNTMSTEWWKSCTDLDITSQAGWEPTGKSQERMSRSKKQDSQRKTKLVRIFEPKKDRGFLWYVKGCFKKEDNRSVLPTCGGRRRKGYKCSRACGH